MSETERRAIATRLKALRAEEAERVPQLAAKLKACADEARLAHLAHAEASAEYHRVSGSLAARAGALEMELRRTARRRLSSLSTGLETFSI